MTSVEVVKWFHEQSKDVAEAVLAICQDTVSKKTAEAKPDKPAVVRRGRGPSKKGQNAGAPAGDGKAQTGTLGLSA